MEAGMQYMKLGTIDFTRNPTVYRKPRADKPIAQSKNLTGTITQVWDILETDKNAHLEWSNLDKATCDLINAYYEAKENCSFTDVYGTVYTVNVSKFTMDRRQFIDSRGFRVVLDLLVVA